MTRLLTLCIGATMMSALFAGCSTGPDTVNKDDVVKQIGDKMTDAAGNKPETVTCPDELAAKVGAEVNCDMKVKGKPFVVNVKVTSIDGSSVKFDMVETVDKSVIAGELSDQLTEQVGRKPDSVTCPDNLKGVEGAKLDCELVDGSETYTVTVTVTGVDAGDVQYSFKVADHPK